MLPLGGQERLDHRDDFRMNSISGGDFRQYISHHVVEEDRWGHAMHLFGTFHNHMHEMMTDLALYGAQRLGDEDRVPHFRLRISGGEWGEYRECLEADGVESSWRQATEIIHDRVRHAMYKSTVHDRVSRARDVDLDGYIGEDRAPHPPGKTVSEPDAVRTESVPRDRFRDFVWHGSFEDRHFHAAMQKILDFDEMFYTLMTEWALYGAGKEEPACRPPSVGERVSPGEWRAYAEQVEGCGDDTWRHFVQVVALMHDRIRDMMYRVMLHNAESSDPG